MASVWSRWRSIISRALELGIPTALEHATVSAGQIVITRINASLGTTALAAAHVAVTAEGLSYMPADGISYAATALVGQSYGAREYEDARRYGKLSGLVGFGCSTFMGLLLFIFATPLSTIFSSDRSKGKKNGGKGDRQTVLPHKKGQKKKPGCSASGLEGYG